MSENNEIQMDPVQNGGSTEVKGSSTEPSSIKSPSIKSTTESRFNLDVKEFLKTYKYEILLGIIIVGSIIFKLWNEYSYIFKNNSDNNSDNKGYYDINMINNDIELPLIIYINLEKDNDRNKRMIKMFEKLNYPKNKIMRFNAIERKPGLEGCRLSHIEANKLGIKNIGNCPYYMICEDDIELVNNFYEIIYPCLRLYEENVDMIKLEGLTNDDMHNPEMGALMVPTNNEMFMRGLYWYYHTLSSQNMGCYLSSSNFGNKIINILNKYPRMHCDLITGLLFNTNKVYISRKILFKQRPHYSHIENRDRKHYPLFDFEVYDKYYENYFKKIIERHFIYNNDKFYLKKFNR